MRNRLADLGTCCSFMFSGSGGGLSAARGWSHAQVKINGESASYRPVPKTSGRSRLWRLEKG